MSSIIIKCQFCSKKNRIPFDREEQRAKCGSCGQILSKSIPNTCKLCNQNVSDGIHLSNGEMIHKSCLESIQTQEKDIKNDIYVKQEELNKSQNEIKRREGVGFKIISIFSKPDVDIDDIKKSIQIIKNKIQQLSLALNNLQTSVKTTYDYFLSYPPDWGRRKGAVLKRDGDCCRKCSCRTHLHLHHIKPLSKGGSNEILNLQLLCENCHSKEHGGRDFNGEFTNSETAFSKRIANIRYAIENGKRIKFGYEKRDDTGYKQRTIQPAMLVNIEHHKDSGSTLCVHGYCELRKAERTFALKRMKGLSVLSV